MNVKINIPKANIKFSASYIRNHQWPPPFERKFLKHHLHSKKDCGHCPPCYVVVVSIISIFSSWFYLYPVVNTFFFQTLLLCRYPICSNFPFTPKALSNSISNLFYVLSYIVQIICISFSCKFNINNESNPASFYTEFT